MSFIRRADERVSQVNAAVQNGPGELRIKKLINSDEELLGKGRLFNDIVLNQNCGVGYHTHQGDAELYYMLEGECEYNDNGVITTIKAGDVTYTAPGEGHGVVNKSQTPARFIALIIYE